MSKAKNEIKMDYVHLAIPSGFHNLIILSNKEQLKLFQPILSDSALLELTVLFNEVVFDIKHFLKYTFALEKAQETKFQLTKVGVTISEYTWNKIPFGDLEPLKKFTQDNSLPVFVVR